MSVVLYTTRFCPYCTRAKRLLDSKGLGYEEINIDGSAEKRQEMLQRANGSHTVPQIFIGDRHIGGCDELYALEHQQHLDTLLQPQAS